MTPNRDSKGRYAKKPENPDCEPATKGYVKCIARTVIAKHNHSIDLSTSSCSVGLIIFVCAWFISGFLAGPGMQFANNPWLIQISWLSGFSALVIILVGCDIGDDNKSTNGESDIKAIQKYEPPKCDNNKKKECK